MTLQATSCNFGGISSLLCPPKTSLHRFVIRAKVEPSEKSVEIMRKFSEQYARRSGTYFCMDKGVTSVVIKKSSDMRHYPVLTHLNEAFKGLNWIGYALRRFC